MFNTHGWKALAPKFILIITTVVNYIFINLDDVTLQQFHKDGDAIPQEEITRISTIIQEIIRGQNFTAFNLEIEEAFREKYWQDIPYPLG